MIFNEIDRSTQTSSSIKAKKKRKHEKIYDKIIGQMHKLAELHNNSKHIQWNRIRASTSQRHSRPMFSS